MVAAGSVACTGSGDGMAINEVVPNIRQEINITFIEIREIGIMIASKTWQAVQPYVNTLVLITKKYQCLMWL
jgi:hypothetical protein